MICLSLLLMLCSLINLSDESSTCELNNISVEYGITECLRVCIFLISKTIQKWVIIFIQCLRYVSIHTIPEIKTLYF